MCQVPALVLPASERKSGSDMASEAGRSSAGHLGKLQEDSWESMALICGAWDLKVHHNRKHEHLRHFNFKCFVKTDFT